MGTNRLPGTWLSGPTASFTESEPMPRELSVAAEQRGAAPVHRGRRRVDRLVEQVLPVAGELAAGHHVGGGDPVEAHDQHRIADRDARRPAELDRLDGQRPQRFDQAEARGAVVADHGRGKGRCRPRLTARPSPLPGSGSRWSAPARRRRSRRRSPRARIPRCGSNARRRRPCCAASPPTGRRRSARPGAGCGRSGRRPFGPTARRAGHPQARGQERDQEGRAHHMPKPRFVETERASGREHGRGGTHVGSVRVSAVHARAKYARATLATSAGPDGDASEPVGLRWGRGQCQRSSAVDHRRRMTAHGARESAARPEPWPQRSPAPGGAPARATADRSPAPTSGPDPGRDRDGQGATGPDRKPLAVICPRCRRDSPANTRFCSSCGTRLARACEACAAALPEDARFCPQCGHAAADGPGARILACSGDLHAPAPRREDPRLAGRAGGERKQVTVLFADIKGSMTLLAERDPEEARRLLDPVLELMMEAVHRYEGTVNQVMGDGIMALFGAPVAHEDHARPRLLRRPAASWSPCALRRGRVPEPRRPHPGARRAELRRGHRPLDRQRPAHGLLGGRPDHAPGRAHGADGRARHDPGHAGDAAPGRGLRAGRAARPGGGAGARGADGGLRADRGEPGPLAPPGRGARGLSRFVGRDAELDRLAGPSTGAGGAARWSRWSASPGSASRAWHELVHSPRTQGWLVLESSAASYGRATSYSRSSIS